MNSMKSPEDKIWKDKPEFARKYYDMRDLYERMCDEVEDILYRITCESDIEVAHIHSRPKTLASFCEKITRKKYENPFEEVEDFAGVRLVYLYASDLEKIESLIESEFEILDKVDKIKDQDVDRFGYGALHYIVKFKKSNKDGRYNDLRDLKCEIQVRTILQDAWAMIAHHLSYKNVSDVPKELQRKLNALSGLFLTADDQFEHLKFSRDAYQKEFKEKIEKSESVLLEQEINLDNLIAYLRWKFPNRQSGSNENIADLLKDIKELNYTYLKEIDEVIEKTIKQALKAEKENPPGGYGGSEKFYDVGMVRKVLSIFHDMTFYADNGYEDE